MKAFPECPQPKIIYDDILGYSERVVINYYAIGGGGQASPNKETEDGYAPCAARCRSYGSLYSSTFPLQFTSKAKGFLLPSFCSIFTRPSFITILHSWVLGFTLTKAVPLSQF